MPRHFTSLLLCLLLTAAAVSFPGGWAWAGEVWKLEASASDEVTTKVDKDGSLTDKSVEKEANFSFQNALIGETELKVEIGVTQTDEIPEGEFNTSKQDITLDAELKGPWWSVSSGWEENVEETDEPGTHSAVDDSYTLEVKLEPEHDALPDLGFKVEGDDSQVSRAYEGKFEYTLLEMFEFKLEADKETSSPRDPAEDSTDDRTYKMEMSFDRDLNESWKFGTAWSNERTQNLTLDPDDHLVEKTDTIDNNFKVKLEYVPLEWLTLKMERELDWSKDFLSGEPTETSDKMKEEITAEPELTDFINLKLSFSDDRESKGGTDANDKSWGQEYSAELSYEPMEIATFTATYDGSDDRTFPEDPAEENTKDHSDEYGLEGEVNLWEDQITLKAKRNFTYNWESGSRSGRERNWEFEGEWKYENFPNLKLTPTWTQTKDEDLLEGTANLENAIEVAIEYVVELGDVTKVELKHTYGRTSFYPDGEVHYIERSDDTSLKVELSDFLTGMTTSGELTRKASDTSEDDEGPEVDYSISWEYTWTALEIYELALKYEFDMPDESDDSKSYEATLSFPFFLEHFDCNLEYSHETQVEGDTNDTHRYLIEVKGEF